jgi:hypothetical protein
MAFGYGVHITPKLSFIMLLYDGEMVKPQFVSEAKKEWNRDYKKYVLNPKFVLRKPL